MCVCVYACACACACVCVRMYLCLSMRLNLLRLPVACRRARPSPIPSRSSCQVCDYMLWKCGALVTCGGPLDKDMRCVAKQTYPAVVYCLRLRALEDPLVEHILLHAFKALHN